VQKSANKTAVFNTSECVPLTQYQETLSKGKSVFFYCDVKHSTAGRVELHHVSTVVHIWLRNCLFLKATKVILARAVSDFLFVCSLTE